MTEAGAPRSTRLAGAFAHERDGWERTPRHATQRAAWGALKRTEAGSD